MNKCTYVYNSIRMSKAISIETVVFEFVQQVLEKNNNNCHRKHKPIYGHTNKFVFRKFL